LVKDEDVIDYEMESEDEI